MHSDTAGPDFDVIQSFRVGKREKKGKEGERGKRDAERGVHEWCALVV